MKFVNIPAIAFVSALTLISLPALAAHEGENHGHPSSHVDAPAPLIGASVPGLAIGYGVYLLIRRRRKLN
jgi:hypothetical protein